MNIRIIEKTNDFYTGKSGIEIGKQIDNLILQFPNQLINISFYGVETVSPSFINGVLLYIIDLYGVEYFKKYIKISEANSKVINIIKDSVNKHFEYKNSFFSNLKTSKYYIATDGTNMGDIIKKYLEVLNNSGKAIILSNYTNSYFTEKSKENIIKSDSIIGILTDKNAENFLLKQIVFALQNNKLCIVLCEKSIYFKIPVSIKNKIQIVRFSNNNLLNTTRDLNEIILRNTSGNKDLTFGDVLLWGGIAFLGGMLIKELAKEKVY